MLACGATISLTLLLQLAMSYVTLALLPSEEACVTLTSPGRAPRSNTKASHTAGTTAHSAYSNVAVICQYPAQNKGSITQHKKIMTQKKDSITRNTDSITQHATFVGVTLPFAGLY